MKSRQGYKGYVIEARSCEFKDNGFSAEFSVEEHYADGVMETEFYLPDTFRTQDSAMEAAIQAGRQKIDMGFGAGIRSREQLSPARQDRSNASQRAIREEIYVEPIGCQLGLWRLLGWSPITLMANF